MRISDWSSDVCSSDLLPDVTVIAPVFDAGELLFWVAARGHQADIGGITPGSMPASSQTVEEEGVLIDDELLVDGGRLLEAATCALLSSGRWPAPNPGQNITYLKEIGRVSCRG